MQTENDITPEVEEVTPDETDPAIAAILRERAKLDAALRRMGYVEPSADAAPADSPDGFYPLHDFGKAPEIEAVEVAKERLREAPKVKFGEPEPAFQGHVGEPVPAGNVPKAPTTIDVDLTDERVIRDAWRKSSVNDREIMVGVKSIGSGNIDKITEGTNAIFHGGMQPWTVRRAIYGSKTHTPATGTLMVRGLIEQTDPSARGRIKYTLTDLGRKAVEYGGQQGKSS